MIRLTAVMRSMTSLASAVMVACLLAGCSAPTAPTEPTLTRVSAETPGAYDHLWIAVGDTLRADYFRIDREDRIAGVMTTHPETSAQALEVWRPQPSPGYHWAESNLHTIAREAKVTIRPVEGIGTYELSVQVDRLRYNLEERQIDNSAAAMRLFSADAPTQSGRMERPAESARLVPLGRDKTAEERLLKKILKRYAKGPSSEELVTEEPLPSVPETPTTQPE